MLLGLAAPPHFLFHRLDFIPLDLNDNGWIVGEKNDTIAVVLMDGRTVRLGVGSSCAINNRNHVLITQSKPFSTTAFLWDKGGRRFVANVDRVPRRLLDNDTFLGYIKSRCYRVRIKPNGVGAVPLPLIPNGDTGSVTDGSVNTEWTAMNTDGTVVGMTNFGWSTSHTVSVDSKGRIVEITPKGEIRPFWELLAINSRGDLLGFHGYDQTIGGGDIAVRIGGKYRDLPPKLGQGYWDAHDINERDEVVGEGKPSKPYANEMHALYWNGKQLYDLNSITSGTAGCVLETAVRINNHAWIVGTAKQGDSRIGYLLTPE
ncbi:MAG TPA: hypothetical protein VG944_01080 [Fimbriimonas sp.]|nr:hypothetical protein [Fimbriimonas sp.]